MNLTALLISICVVVGICVIFWLLERIFDIDGEDIAKFLICAACIYVSIGIIYIFICPKEDLEHARDVVYEIDNQFSDNQNEKQSECSLLGDSCVVDEWGFECLFTKCIIDSRK